MFQYKVKVWGLVVKEHPHQELFQNLQAASIAYDELCKKYPEYDVQFTELKESTLKFCRKQVKPAEKDCPFGHSRLLVAEKSAVQVGLLGKLYCVVCGWKEV